MSEEQQQIVDAPMIAEDEMEFFEPTKLETTGE